MTACPKSHDQAVNVLTVDNMRGEERMLCAFDKPLGGWRAVTAAVDSGAEETVAPPGRLPGRVAESPMQRSGGRCRAANGARIPNLGQQLVQFKTDEGHGCSLRFQIAGVERPLISVSQLGKTGHRVEFGADAGYIVHQGTGRRIMLQRSGGVYLLKMRVRDGPGPAAPAGASGFSWPRQ